MDQNRLVETCRKASLFLHTYSWLFDFSNVKILSQRQNWPDEWNSFIDEQNVDSLKNILNGRVDNCPQFVQDFVKQRQSILRMIESSIICDYEEASELTKQQQNLIKRGMNEKKQHEVFRLGNFILKECHDFQHVIDVGSGAGHLERYLLHSQCIAKDQIVCIESNASHVESSNRLAKSMSVSTIEKTLVKDPKVYQDLNSKIEEMTMKTVMPESSALIGLHACGDLTTSMIDWFSNFSSFGVLAVVSCCYHKMSQFPSSDQLKEILPSCLKSHFALRLACQDAFDKWMSQSQSEHNNHAKTFGRRALQESIADQCGQKLQKQNRHGIRKSHFKSKEEFLESASTVYKTDNEDLMKAKLNQQWTEDFEWLEIVTGLQSFLQIILEYLVMMDRIFLLLQNGQKNIKLYRLFEKTKSPRNLLLWCQKI